MGYASSVIEHGPISAYICQTGVWVVEAAKEWPDATIVSVDWTGVCGGVDAPPQVGFDLANIQVPTKHLDPSIATRIQWKHGNL